MNLLEVNNLKTYFFDEKKKSKNNIFRKFSKKSTFLDQKSDRKNSDFSQIFTFSRFLKNIFSSKKNIFRRKFSFFIFVSYIKSNLSEWHRATPTVHPVSAVNAPSKIRKIAKILKNPRFVTIRRSGSNNKLHNYCSI